jgi:hypothetical protein
MDPEVRPMRSRFLENLAYLVPGYRGYKERGRRRDEDSRFRALLLHRLGEIRSTVVDLVIRLADGPHDAGVQEVEGRGRRLDSLADAIRYAPYGFSGFFDAPEIGEDTLDRILEIDLLLFEDLDAVEQILLGSIPVPTGRGKFQTFLDQLDEAIIHLEHHLIQRDKTLGDA